MRTALTAAVSNDDRSAFERLRPQLDGANGFGSLLWAADMPTPKADWQIGYLNELVDALGKMRICYRDEEIRRVAEDAEFAR